ncbi:MAG TPA: hypothetical protein VKH43_01205 [Thermoanaerobaculia bacterium]|nr:hypothetical protein [Thermoanaerobaculia bacterium]
MFRKEGILGGVGIGAALVVALGAVSFLVKAGWSGFGHPRLIPAHDSRQPQAVRAQPAPLPEDFDELCRAAGI